MKKHPTEEALLRYCETSGEREEAQAVRAHLEEPCERCLQKTAAYREVLSCLDTPVLERAPEERIQEALRMIEARVPKPVPGAARRAAAASIGRLRGAARALRETPLRLVFDSSLAPALQGIRAHAALAPRQLLFESEMGSLHLQVVEEEGGRAGLTGQFLPASRSATGRKLRVTLRQADTESERALDAAGSFDFHAVGSTIVSLRVVFGDSALETGPIDLRLGPDA